MPPTQRLSLVLLAATLLVAGCSSVHNDDPLRPAALAQPGATTPGATQQARVLSGTARHYRQPLAGAEVVARELSVKGEGPVLARATADAQGAFSLNFPPSVVAGKVVQLVARGAQGQRVMALGQVPQAISTVAGASRRLAQAEEAPLGDEVVAAGPLGPLVLDENQTLALMVLAPRIKAALELGTELAIANALASLQAAGEALGSEGVDLVDPAVFDEAVNLVFGLVDQLLDTQEAREAVARTIPPEAVEQLVAQAEALADVIRQEVLENGLQRPSDDLTGPLAIGDKDVPSVFQTTTEPNNPTEPGAQPGPTTNDPITPPDPDVTIDLVASEPAEGVFGAPTGAIEGVTQ